MPGLLDYYVSPEGQALTGIASGLLQSGGPSRMPVSFGQALGGGLLQGSQMAQIAARSQLANAYLGEQTRAMQMSNQIAEQRAPLLNALAMRLAAGGGGGAAPAPQMGVSDASAAGVGAPWAAASGLPQPAPQGGGYGGVAGLGLQDLALLKMLGGPDLIDVYNAGQPNIKAEGGLLIDAKRGVIGTVPQVNQQGFSTTLVPDGRGGFRIQITPGAEQAYGAQQRIGEEAKAGLDIVKVPDPNGPPGATVDMTRADYVRALSGARAAQPSATGQAATLYGQAPDEQTALAMARRLTQSGQPATIGVGFTPQPSQILGRTPAPSEIAGATEFAQGKAKEAVAESTRWRNAHMETSDRIGQLDLLQSLMSDPNVASGAAAEQISGLKGLADSFGINIAGKRGEDAIQAVAGEMALKLRVSGGQNLMPGQMSDFEQKMLRSMSPALAQSREGRLLIVQIARAKNERDLKLAEMAANYEDANGRIDSGFYKQAREYVRANPLYAPDRIAAMTELAKRLGGGR